MDISNIKIDIDYIPKRYYYQLLNDFIYSYCLFLFYNRFFELRLKIVYLVFLIGLILEHIIKLSSFKEISLHLTSSILIWKLRTEEYLAKNNKFISLYNIAINSMF